MNTPLWQPSADRINTANITRFMSFVNERCSKDFSDYFSLHEWSVNSIPDFWAAVWDFLDIKASKRYEKVVEDLTVFPGANWFPGAELNFAER